jgi:GTPase SAR1 family protein
MQQHPVTQHPVMTPEHTTMPQQHPVTSQPIVLKHPFTKLIAGPTGCGKSTLVQRLLRNKESMFKPPPKRIIWFYKRWQPLYDIIKNENKNLEFIQGLPENIKHDTYFDTRHPTLFIIDDLMHDATKSGMVCELFTEGSHHRNLSVICLLQNLYYKGKELRTMSLNSHYITIFKNPRDQQQVSVLARQMYPTNPNYLLEEFESATSTAHGYLFIDLKQSTADDKRLQTNIFTNNDINSNHFITGLQMDNTTPCLDCGALYATHMDLKRHVKRGCPESETDCKRLKVDNSSAFDSLVNKAFEKYDAKYSELVERFVNDDNTEEEAEQKASETLQNKYIKTFLNIYKDFLTNTLELNQNILHQDVLQMIEEYMEDGNSINRAVSLSVEYHRPRLEDLLKEG